MHRAVIRAAIACLAAIALAPAAPAAPAARIVSLNLCADDYLLTLAPEQAVGVTSLARDPALSVVTHAAGRVPVVPADPEAVLALKPDLVLAARFGAQATLAALGDAGIRVELLDLPENFPGIRAETRRLGALLHVPGRAASAIAAMDRRLASVPSGIGTVALYLEPRGWTAGAQALAGAVLAAAGMRDVGDGTAWPLERIAAHPPALLVMQEAAAAPSLATEFLRHPALAGIPTRTLPGAELLCGGPWTADAVAALAAGSPPPPAAQAAPKP